MSRIKGLVARGVLAIAVLCLVGLVPVAARDFEKPDCFEVLDRVRLYVAFHPYAESVGPRLAEANRLCQRNMDAAAIRVVMELGLLAAVKLEGMAKDAGDPGEF